MAQYDLPMTKPGVAGPPPNLGLPMPLSPGGPPMGGPPMGGPMPMPGGQPTGPGLPPELANIPPEILMMLLQQLLEGGGAGGPPPGMPQPPQDLFGGPPMPGAGPMQFDPNMGGLPFG